MERAGTTVPAIHRASGLTARLVHLAFGVQQVGARVVRGVPDLHRAAEIGRQQIPTVPAERDRVNLADVILVDRDLLALGGVPDAYLKPVEDAGDPAAVGTEGRPRRQPL